MCDSLHFTNKQDSTPAPLGARDGEGKRGIGRRRFDRGIGAWLGGIVVGTGGCIFGASLSYHHPVGVVVSVLWWGLYFGSFGMCLGALLGMWAEPIPAYPSQEGDGAGKPPVEVDSLTALADDRSFVPGASRAPGGIPGLPAMSKRTCTPGR
jgi:hypothetical protein